MMALAALARNLPPSTTHGMYLLGISTGTSDFVGRLRLINHPANSNPQATDSKIAMNMWNRIRTLAELRQTVIRQDVSKP